MKFYGIANPQGGGPIIRLEKGLPDLLALGHRGEVLPVFGPEAALRAFVRAHTSLEADGSESVETVMLGGNFIEVAELISPVVEAGEVETVVFDPVLNADGEWVSEAFKWSAENFCDFFTAVRPVVEDVARRREGIPADRQPSPEALDKALDWYMWRMLVYLHGPSRIISEVRQVLGLKD